MLNNQQTRAVATKRLLRDLREWKNCAHEATSITAEPLENNIFEWHVNFVPDDGPLKGIIFHLIINFPDNYPLKKPEVTLCNYLNHPNVFRSGVYGSTKYNGYWICLDMIKDHGWSAAYSVTSILFQLLSFLITKKAPQDHGGDKYITHASYDIQKMRQKSKSFHCKKCKHNNYAPYPALHEYKTNQTHNPRKQSQKIYLTQKTAKKINYWSKLLYDDVEAVIIDFLSIADLLTLSRVNQCFKKLVRFSSSFQLQRFSCWYHRIDLRYSQLARNNTKISDKVATNLLLGYGIIPKFYENHKRIFSNYFHTYEFNNGVSKLSKILNDSSLSFPTLESCETTFDLISSNAFINYKIRKTPRKDKTFTAFIPMYIHHNRFHGIKSLEKLKQFTLDIYRSHNENINKYHPMMSIHIIGNIMNTLVVELMNSYSIKDYDKYSIYDAYNNKTSLHHSINVLETYFHFYHILLAVYFKYFDICNPLIQTKCINFIKNVNLRHKNYVPNLGVFNIWFTLLNVSNNNDINVNNIFQSLLEESFVRRAKWLINDFGIEYEKGNFDIQQSFDASTTSIKLFLFQYYFLNQCCDLGIKSPKQKFKQLNKTLGCVSTEIALKLQNFCKNIMTNVTNWRGFFNVINMSYPGHKKVYLWLKNSIKISEERGYHKSILDEEKHEQLILSYPNLFEAVHKNDIKKVEQYFATNKIFDKCMTDANGRTPLFIASHLCHVNMVKILIKKDFNANVIDVYGKTAIKAALDGKNKENAKQMNQIIKLLRKQIKKQNEIEKREEAMRNNNEKYAFATRYVRVTGLPYEVNKEDVKVVFKRYGFTSNICNECIWLKNNFILLKIKETNIPQKMEKMNNGFCFSNRIHIKINEFNRNNKIENECNNILFVHNFDIIDGIKEELNKLFNNSYDIRIGVNKFNEPYAMLKFNNIIDAQQIYNESKINSSQFIVNGNMLKIEYAHKYNNNNSGYNNGRNGRVMKSTAPIRPVRQISTTKREK